MFRLAGSPKAAAAAINSAEKKPTDSDHIARKILESKTEILVSDSKNATPETSRIDLLIAKAKKEGRSIIFTVTPGPFIDFTAELSESTRGDWMKSQDAVGCSIQLKTFEEAVGTLNADVYAINKHSSKYQCGPTGLLGKKEYHNLRMISDPEFKLQEEFGLPTFTLGDSKYIGRITIAIRPNGESQVFNVPRGPIGVNAETVRKHLEDIKNFLSPTPIAEPVVSAAASLAS